jgi:hypothetical protein
LTATLRGAGFQMYFGEAMWVVLNVVEPGARNHIQDAVEQEVRGIQAAIQGGGLSGWFSVHVLRALAHESTNRSGCGNKRSISSRI